MNDQWKTYLHGIGASVDEQRVLHFGNPAQERTVLGKKSVIADLSHQGLIEAKGSDAQSFLMAQCTNDVMKVSESSSQLNGYCTAKGRLIALFRVFQRGDNFYLNMPRELIANVVKRLSMYILRSDVQLTDASEHLLHFGYAGPNADTELTRILAHSPKKPNEILQTAGLSVIRVPGVDPRYEIFGEYSEVFKLWEALSVDATPIGGAVWELLDIYAGIPTIHAENVEAFVPQMINLDLINALSFTKGCYPGQEIVARTHYLGKLKRRMYRLHASIDDVPDAATAIYNPAQDGDRKIGTVVAAQPAVGGGVDLLASLEINACGGDLALGDTAGPQLTLMNLPYSVDTKEKEP